MQLSIETSMHEFYEDVGPFWYLYLFRWERASLFAWYKTNIGENNLRYRKKKKERPSSVAAFFLPGSKLCRAEQVFLKISRSVHINRVFLCFFTLYPNVRLCSNKCKMRTTSVERWYEKISEYGRRYLFCQIMSARCKVPGYWSAEHSTVEVLRVEPQNELTPGCLLYGEN